MKIRKLRGGMMKTPEEIKKGLEQCAETETCENCHYRDDCMEVFRNSPLTKDALAYIQQLESRLAQVERERDAAIADVESLCSTNYFSGNYCEYCKHKETDGKCNHPCVAYSSDWGWEWRGVCEENTKEENR